MEKTAIYTYGRFQSVTKGHELLFSQLINYASKYKADQIFVGLSQSVDTRSNPLRPAEKEKILKKLLPNLTKQITFVNQQTITNPFQMMEVLIRQGFLRLYLVVGSDQASSLRQLDKYAKQINQKASATILVAGNRDNLQLNGQIVSGTMMRQFAAQNNLKDFIKAAPTQSSPAAVVDLFKLLRLRMGLSTNESLIAWSDKYPKPGMLVETEDGSLGKVVSVSGKVAQVKITRSGTFTPIGIIQEHLVESLNVKSEEAIRGTLLQSPSGFIYVKIPDQIIHGFFEMIDPKDQPEKPPYFNSKSEEDPVKVGAHISVIYKDETINQEKLSAWIGQEVPMFVSKFSSVNPEGWDTMEKVWFLEVKSPKLESIRKDLGLSPLLQGHPFHITVAVKLTKNLSEALDSHSVSIALNTKISEIRNGIKNGKGDIKWSRYSSGWSPSRSGHTYARFWINPFTLDLCTLDYYDHTAAIALYPEKFRISKTELIDAYHKQPNLIYNTPLLKSVFSKGWIRAIFNNRDSLWYLQTKDIKSIQVFLNLMSKSSYGIPEDTVIDIDYGELFNDQSDDTSKLSGSQIRHFIQTGNPNMSLLHSFREELSKQQ